MFVPLPDSLPVGGPLLPVATIAGAAACQRYAEHYISERLSPHAQLTPLQLRIGTIAILSLTVGTLSRCMGHTSLSSARHTILAALATSITSYLSATHKKSRPTTPRKKEPPVASSSDQNIEKPNSPDQPGPPPPVPEFKDNGLVLACCSVTMEVTVVTTKTEQNAGEYVNHCSDEDMNEANLIVQALIKHNNVHKVRTEIQENEQKFRDDFSSYSGLLTSLVQATGITDDQRAKLTDGFEDLTTASIEFTSMLEKLTPEEAYSNNHVLTRYFDALGRLTLASREANRVFNALRTSTNAKVKAFNFDELQRLALAPAQRGPKHKVFLQRLCEIEPAYKPLLEPFAARINGINRLFDFEQLKHLSDALTQVSHGGHKIHIKTVDGRTEYQAVKIERRAGGKSKTKDSNTDIRSSEGVLEGIVKFLLGVREKYSDDAEIFTESRRCATILAKSQWWTEKSTKQLKQDLQEITN